eukprot:CAMPEP_0197439386 /NCGR_PEP_ID=MMETSP1175-20131217/6145_1 /TAXON_ID=1003142 /ORGANISM="Triceratium dubium, Strain CCMP147" /LENGTH=201 /DNA_ID=CAMNT_0042969297 /DNA_START=67 /DNA_END=672 /DNA_ORIENTATION=-
MRTALSRLALVSALSRIPSCSAAFVSAPRCAQRSVLLGRCPASAAASFDARGGRSATATGPRDTVVGRRSLSSFGSDPPVEIARVNKDGLEEIFEDIDRSGRDGSGYVVIDVRGEDEIAATGKISPHAETLPLPLIAMNGAFGLDEDEFEDAFGFTKPSMDETIVFSCKAGIRSYQAAQFAAMAGYSSLINYTGGADEWFR